MEINRFAVEEKLKRQELPDGGFFWLHSRNIYETEIEPFIYDFEIPDENGSPSSMGIEYLLKILRNFDRIQRDCISFIKLHLTIQGDYSLQNFKILKAPDRHDAEAILNFWRHEDGYLYTEIGLMELRPRDLLIKYR